MRLSTQIVTLLIITSSIAYAQPILYKKDGTKLQARITGTNDSQLVTEKGNIEIMAIDSIVFGKESQGLAYLKKSIADKGVVVIDKVNQVNKIISTEEKSPLFLKSNPIESVDLSQFVKQRNAGKSAQLVGMLIIGSAMVLQSIYNNQYSEDLSKFKQGDPTIKQKFVPGYVPAAGLGIFIVGLSVDLSASKFLRKN
jgi:hypothetical protein